MFEQQPALEPDPPPLPVVPVLPFDAQLVEGSPTDQTILMLLHTDPTTLRRDDAVAAAVGVELAKRLLDGLAARLQAHAAGPQPLNREVDEVAQEFSAALDMHPHTAVAQVSCSRSLVRRLPVTLKALEAGQISRRQAEHVERLTRDLDDETARNVEAMAVPGSARRLNARLMRELARQAPDVLEKKTQQRRAERSVETWSDPVEGVAGMAVQGPLELMAQIKAAIDVEAKDCPAGECREIAQRRFDALLGWARRALGLDEPVEGASGPKGRCDACGRSGPARIPIAVTVSAETLLRMSDTPGELDGYGPISADVARELAAGGEWRRWFVGSGGRLLDIGANTYRPRAALDRFVRGRDRTCRFPSCNAPAVRCDLDHTLSFHGEGGETTECNLGPLCRHHHRLKHETDWSYERLPNGDVVWTAPSGRRYVKKAEYHGDDPWLNDVYRRLFAKLRRDEASAYAHAGSGSDADDEPPF